eukprot:gene4262-6584_t
MAAAMLKSWRARLSERLPKKYDITLSIVAFGVPLGYVLSLLGKYEPRTPVMVLRHGKTYGVGVVRVDPSFLPHMIRAVDKTVTSDEYVLGFGTFPDKVVSIGAIHQPVLEQPNLDKRSKDDDQEQPVAAEPAATTSWLSFFGLGGAAPVQESAPPAKWLHSRLDESLSDGETRAELSFTENMYRDLHVVPKNADDFSPKLVFDDGRHSLSEERSKSLFDIKGIDQTDQPSTPEGTFSFAMIDAAQLKMAPKGHEVPASPLSAGDGLSSYVIHGTYDEMMALHPQVPDPKHVFPIILSRYAVTAAGLCLLGYGISEVEFNANGVQCRQRVNPMAAEDPSSRDSLTPSRSGPTITLPHIQHFPAMG